MPCKPPSIRPQPSTNDISAARNQHNSPLLRLPAEFRNTIYAYVLAERTPVIAHTLNHIGVDLPHGLTLLATCRQLHLETFLVPLKLNTLRFVSLKMFEQAALSWRPA
jgi:hypothetical protein